MRTAKIAACVAVALASTALAVSAQARTPAPVKRPAAVRDEAARPMPAPKENRIITYNYSPDIIFRIATLPELHTFIRLAEDEGVVELPVIGDNAQWRVSGGPRDITVKPLRNNLTTSMTLVTNKRTYQFQLVSGADVGAEVFQQVTFLYPDRDQEIKLRKEIQAGAVEAEKTRLADQIVAPNVDPSSLDFGYTIEGTASFRPTAVYTNGQFTFLVMPNIQDSPAVFLMDDEGNPSLINWKVKGQMIVVERKADRLLLKLGSAEVRIAKKGVPSKTNW